MVGVVALSLNTRNLTTGLPTVYPTSAKLIDDVNFQGKYSSLPYSVARREDYLIPSIKHNNQNIRIDIESINFLNSIIIINKR
jgi:hypothetical protein